jgi:hypothetical protein
VDTSLGLLALGVAALALIFISPLIIHSPTYISIASNSLRSSSSCNATNPTVDAGVLTIMMPSNGSCVVPWPNVAAAMSYTPYRNVTTIQFNATFTGTNGAPSNDFIDQMVVSLENQTSNEFGIYVGMPSGILFGYIENSASGAYPTTILLEPPNGTGYNAGFNYSGNFKITLSYVNGTNIVNYYLNNTPIGEVRYASAQNYSRLTYYLYVAAQRVWSKGWHSSGDELRINNLSITAN